MGLVLIGWVRPKVNGLSLGSGLGPDRLDLGSGLGPDRLDLGSGLDPNRLG